MADTTGTTDVLARLEALEADNRRLAAEVRALRSTPAPNATDAALSRRALLRLAGAGVVGAGAAVAGGVVGAKPAAADGPNVLLGNGDVGTGNNAMSAVTSIVSNTGTKSAFIGINSGAQNGGILGMMGAASGLVTAAGVVGDANQGLAIGVSGTNGLGTGVKGTAFSDASDIFLAGVFGVTNDGHDVPGVLGVQGNAVVDVNTSSGAGTSKHPWCGVLGATNQVDYGVVGTNSVGTGVYGCAFGSADNSTHMTAAVAGDTNSATNPAMHARNSAGIGLRSHGALAPLLLDPASTPGPPITGAHSQGEVFVDSNGVQWLCTAAGTFGGSPAPTFLRVITSGVNGVSGSTPGVQVNEAGTGNALIGNVTNASSVAAAVYGVTSGPGQGAKGYNSGTGIGVYGQVNNTANASPAVYGNTNGKGPGAQGNQTGTGYGVLGNINNSANSVAAVRGVTNGTGPGVQGVGSATGRGGQFSGGAAQLQLVPASTTGHPSSGQKGDLVLDSTGTLFLCQGGTTWKTVQLA